MHSLLDSLPQSYLSRFPFAKLSRVHSECKSPAGCGRSHSSPLQEDIPVPQIYLYCPPLPLQSWALEASHGLRPQTKVSSFSKEFVLQSHLLPSVSKGNENPRDSPFGFWTCFACLRVSFLPSTYNEKASSDICMRTGRYLLKKYPVAKGMSQGQS